MTMTTTDVCNVHKTQGNSMLFYDSNEMVLGNQHVSTNLDIITVLKSLYVQYSEFIDGKKTTFIEMSTENK